MNLPTFFIGLLVLVIFLSIVVRGIRNRRHGKSGCSCGCDTCAGCDLCHSPQDR